MRFCIARLIDGVEATTCVRLTVPAANVFDIKRFQAERGTFAFSLFSSYFFISYSSSFFSHTRSFLLFISFSHLFYTCMSHNNDKFLSHSNHHQQQYCQFKIQHHCSQMTIFSPCYSHLGKIPGCVFNGAYNTQISSYSNIEGYYCATKD